MNRHKLVFLLLACLATVWIVFAACSSDDDETTDTDATEQSTETANLTPEQQKSADWQEIEAMFDEIATRWRHDDYGVLYDNEFEYLHYRHTFDEYLTFGQIDWLRENSDTLYDMNVLDIRFYDRDSADVRLDVVFIGLTGDTTHFVDQAPYRCYYRPGGWHRPTVSVHSQQEEFENLRRKADSAAAAEAELEGL